MSTTPEDHTGPENTGPKPEGAGQPTFEPATSVAEAPRDSEARYSGAEHSEEEHHPAEEDGTGEETGAGAVAVSAAGGVLSAETFALVGLALLAVTVLSGQLVELFTGMVLVGGNPIAAEQITQIRTQIAAGGTLALLTALASALSLALANAGSRPWARWAATAGLIVGLLFVLVAVAAFLMIPDAAPAQPMAPPF
ncbi:hypothetical protein [Nocardiopsis flavescens]